MFVAAVYCCQTFDVIGHCERHLIRALLAGDWCLGGEGEDVSQQQLEDMDKLMKPDVRVGRAAAAAAVVQR